MLIELSSVERQDRVVSINKVRYRVPLKNGKNAQEKEEKNLKSTLRQPDLPEQQLQ